MQFDFDHSWLDFIFTVPMKVYWIFFTSVNNCIMKIVYSLYLQSVIGANFYASFTMSDKKQCIDFMSNISMYKCAKFQLPIQLGKGRR